ncbi:unnamed protein product, partial [Medioppia subpectinata]
MTKHQTRETEPLNDTIIEMKGKSFTLQVSAQSGAIQTITVNGTTHRLNQSFLWYQSVGRNGTPGIEDSGSYNFCPNGSAHAFPADQQRLLSRHVSGGVHELNQWHSDYAKQT